MPLAYKAPTTLPALVPATTEGAKPLASSILMTPMCANPLAAPPPRAMPILIGGAEVMVPVASGTTGAGLGGLLPQAARVASRRHARARGKAPGRMPKDRTVMGA